MTWEIDDGSSTSNSPAAARVSGNRDTASAAELLRGVYEALELPGSTVDYHFALLGAYEALRKHCRTDPDLLPEFERLCLLDIALVKARPETITHGTDDKPFLAHVPAFGYLIRLYEREGFLADALAIAKSAAACGQGTEQQKRLQERLHALQAEHG